MNVCKIPNCRVSRLGCKVEGKETEMQPVLCEFAGVGAFKLHYVTSEEMCINQIL